MLSAEDLRKESIEDLKTMFWDISAELFDIRNSPRDTVHLERPHRIRVKKRELARILTVLKERGECVRGNL